MVMAIPDQTFRAMVAMASDSLLTRTNVIMSEIVQLLYSKIPKKEGQPDTIYTDTARNGQWASSKEAFNNAKALLEALLIEKYMKSIDLACLIA